MGKTVAEIMTPNPISVTPNTPLKEAITLIAEKKISGLPVIDEEGKLTGMISESDLMWQETGVETPPYIMILDTVIYLQNLARYEKAIHKALGQTVADVMSDRPITIQSHQLVKAAAKLMHDKKIRRLPVVDQEGKIVGIITQGDIVRMMANDES